MSRLGRDAEAFRRRVVTRARAEALLPAGEVAIVACSGGIDSVTLLHVLAGLAQRDDARLHVAHVDHGIRPDSAADGELVAASAASLGLPCRRLAVSVPRRADGGASEAGARDARYAALEALADEVGATRIALGHTADDQAETLILHMGRGAGPDGLAGMTASAPREALTLIRPLLAESRAAVTAYAQAAGLRWREDTTNRDEAYLRNRVRHRVMPVLRASFGDGVVDRLAGLAGRMADERELRAWAVAREEGRSWQRRAATPVADAAGLAASPRALRRAVLAHCAALAGLPQGLYARHIEALERLCLDRRGSASFDLPGGLQARRTYDELVFERRPTSSVPEALAPVPISRPGRYPLPGSRAALVIAPGSRNERRDGVADVDVGAPSAPPFPLMLRPLRPGDRLTLPGGTKKLARLLSDRKIPRERRSETLVLCGCDGEVLAAVIPTGMPNGQPELLRGGRALSGSAVDADPREGELGRWVRLELDDDRLR